MTGLKAGIARHGEEDQKGTGCQKITISTHGFHKEKLAGRYFRQRGAKEALKGAGGE